MMNYQIQPQEHLQSPLPSFHWSKLTPISFFLSSLAKPHTPVQSKLKSPSIEYLHLEFEHQMMEIEE